MNYTGVTKTITPGEYPGDYPITVNIKEDEMPAPHYAPAIKAALQHVNDELEMNIYEITTSDDARYVFDYSRINSSFSFGDLVQKNGIGYIGDAIVYIKNDLESEERVKETTIHETGIHGTGFSNHSKDKKDIGYSPTRTNETSGYSQNEKNTLKIYLKLPGNSELLKYEID